MEKAVKISFICCLVFLILFCPGCGTPKASGLEYDADDETKTCIIIGRGSCNESEFKIPKKIDGYRVVEIGEKAFAGEKDIIYVSIPSGVTAIGNSAFEECTKLEKIRIPSTVNSIGECSFRKCVSLKKIRIPNGITRIENETFEQCESLKKIRIPNSVISIGKSGFACCKKVKRVKLSGKLERIEESAFDGCSELWAVNIPNSVKKIEMCAFWNCWKLKIVKISRGAIVSHGFGSFSPEDKDLSLILIYHNSDSEKWLQEYDPNYFSGKTRKVWYVDWWCNLIP